jgi:hypothetical protein
MCVVQYITDCRWRNNDVAASSGIIEFVFDVCVNMFNFDTHVIAPAEPGQQHTYCGGS